MVKEDQLTDHFIEVTEIEGQQVSVEQLERTCHRYHWAARQAQEKDVLEVACGSGPGLGLLKKSAKTLVAGDYSDAVLKTARKTYGKTLELERFGAENIPYPNASFDLILMFEAIYYIENPEQFFNEARRVLRPNGKLLLVTANKDIFGFNPSPFSHRYMGVLELAETLKKARFSTRFEGLIDTQKVGIRQRILTPVKFIATKLHIIPKTMHGKGWLKKLFFGTMTSMPASIEHVPYVFAPACPLPDDKADRRFKVIYCTASLDERET